jgi:hypothetical protein
MVSNWEEHATNKRARIQASIPKEWVVQSPASDTSAVELLASSNLLTSEEVKITRSAATDLVKKLATGELKSVEVTLAFCKRAALVHQAVSMHATSLWSKLTLLVYLRQTVFTNSSQKLLWHKRRSWTPILPKTRKQLDLSTDCQFP